MNKKKIFGKKDCQDKENVKDMEDLKESQNQEEKIEENAENTAEESKVSEEKPAEEEQVDERDLQLAEMKNKYLLLAAEFDNFRKRTIKEKSDLLKYGSESVLNNLLPVLDNLERAQENLNKSTDIDALKQGLELVFKQLIDTLGAAGLQKIDAVGKDFNTDFHEAIAMIPAPSDEMKGKVIDCVTAGYMLHDKVIRHAKVAIGQ